MHVKIGNCCFSIERGDDLLRGRRETQHIVEQLFGYRTEIRAIARVGAIAPRYAKRQQRQDYLHDHAGCHDPILPATKKVRVLWMLQKRTASMLSFSSSSWACSKTRAFSCSKKSSYKSADKGMCWCLGRSQRQKQGRA